MAFSFRCTTSYHVASLLPACYLQSLNTLFLSQSKKASKWSCKMSNKQGLYTVRCLPNSIKCGAFSRWPISGEIMSGSFYQSDICRNCKHRVHGNRITVGPPANRVVTHDLPTLNGIESIQYIEMLTRCCLPLVSKTFSVFNVLWTKASLAASRF